VTVDLAAHEPSRRAILWTLAGAGAFQAIYGLAEYFSGHQRIFGYVKTRYTEVATGTFINRNHYAGYLEMTLPLTIALAATAISRLRGAREDDRGRLAFRAALVLIVALTMATALICSRSRMGIASMTVAIVGVGLLLGGRGRGPSSITRTATTSSSPPRPARRAASSSPPGSSVSSCPSCGAPPHRSPRAISAMPR